MNSFVITCHHCNGDFEGEIILLHVLPLQVVFVHLYILLCWFFNMVYTNYHGYIDSLKSNILIHGKYYSSAPRKHTTQLWFIVASIRMQTFSGIDHIIFPFFIFLVGCMNITQVYNALAEKVTLFSFQNVTWLILFPEANLESTINNRTSHNTLTYLWGISIRSTCFMREWLL